MAKVYSTQSYFLAAQLSKFARCPLHKYRPASVFATEVIYRCCAQATEWQARLPFHYVPPFTPHLPVPYPVVLYPHMVQPMLHDGQPITSREPTTGSSSGSSSYAMTRESINITDTGLAPGPGLFNQSRFRSKSGSEEEGAVGSSEGGYLNLWDEEGRRLQNFLKNDRGGEEGPDPNTGEFYLAAEADTHRASFDDFGDNDGELSLGASATNTARAVGKRALQSLSQGQ
ncbi:uncharacterized protein EV420DRAFT_1488913 [Desarmillaria tabescens]|uniref:Uncharacterized protein n=1 Tax=Armillaria tabescens TaxID=1929756 RepID=A0AA39J3X1_ARMTA|nr:uncharacterized protein EV420DRAFT_1488913 [Desarmillaria tabescens]KAK0433903.1 hypothetical protein EV420DRAFT_1488913 [Desarmillaria tabescens]